MEIFRRLRAGAAAAASAAARTEAPAQHQNFWLLPVASTDPYAPAAVNDADASAAPGVSAAIATSAAAAVSAAAATSAAGAALVGPDVEVGDSSTPATTAAATGGQDGGAVAVEEDAAAAASSRGATAARGGLGVPEVASLASSDAAAAAACCSGRKGDTAAGVCAGVAQQRGSATAAAAHEAASAAAAEGSPQRISCLSFRRGRKSAGRKEEQTHAVAGARWGWRRTGMQQQQHYRGQQTEEQQRRQLARNEEVRRRTGAAEDSAPGSWCTHDVAQETADSDCSVLLVNEEEEERGTARAETAAAAAAAQQAGGGQEGGGRKGGRRKEPIRSAEAVSSLEKAAAAATATKAAAPTKAAAGRSGGGGGAAAWEGTALRRWPTAEEDRSVQLPTTAAEEAAAAAAQEEEEAAAAARDSQQDGSARTHAGEPSPPCGPCRRQGDGNDSLAASQEKSFFESFFFEGKKFTFFNKRMRPGWRRAITERDIHQDFESSPAYGGNLLSRAKKQAKSRWEKFSFGKVLLSFLPIIHVLGTYKRSYVMPDFFAGVSEGVMAVPMGMSYAMLAKLPPQLGLYVGLFYPLMYTCVGTSVHVNVGVSAIEDLLTGEAVSRIIHEKDWVLQVLAKKEQLQQQQQLYAQQQRGQPVDETGAPVEQLPAHLLQLQQNVKLEEELLEKMRLDVAVGLCVCIGLVYIGMRLLHAHMLADLLSVPVLSGFSTASAFLIGTSQLKHFLGLAVPPQVENADFKLPRQWWFFLTHLHEANWVAVLVCVASLWILAMCKYVGKKYFKKFPLPGPLIIAVFFTLVNYLARLDRRADLRVIGSIPKGFPSPSLPAFSIPVLTYDDQQQPQITHRVVFLEMLRESLALTAMFFIIHISIAKTLEQQKKTYQLQPEQELVALACCNFFGSFFQCFPCATSLSRSSVAAAAGARTQLHSLSNVLLLLLTLSLITPLLYHLPTAVLAAVVLFGVYGMMDFRELFRLCKIGGPDLLLWLACFLTTIIFGAVEGIIASIVLSLLWLLRKTARPQCITLGRLPNTRIYRNLTRFPMATEHPGIKIVRFDASLNFSNSDFFEARVRQKLLPGTRVLVVDGSSINDLDVTAVRMLQRLCGYLRQRDTLLLFANWKGPMRDFLERAAFYTTLPPELCFLSLQDAVYYAQTYIHQKRAAEQQQLHSQQKVWGESVARRYCKRANSPAAPLEPFYWQEGHPQQREREEQEQPEEAALQQLEQDGAEPQQRVQLRQQPASQQGEHPQRQLGEMALKLALLRHEVQEQQARNFAAEGYEVKNGYLRCRRSEDPEPTASGLLFEGTRSRSSSSIRRRGSGREEEEEGQQEEQWTQALPAPLSTVGRKGSPHGSEAAAGDSSMSTASLLPLRTSRSVRSDSSRDLHIPLRYYLASRDAGGSASELEAGAGAFPNRRAATQKSPGTSSALPAAKRGAAAAAVLYAGTATASAATTSSCAAAAGSSAVVGMSSLRSAAERRRDSRRRDRVSEPVPKDTKAFGPSRTKDFWSARGTRENAGLSHTAAGEAGRCRHICEPRQWPLPLKTASPSWCRRSRTQESTLAPASHSVCLRSRSMTDVTSPGASRGFLLRRYSTCSTARMTINEEAEAQGGREAGLQQREGNPPLESEQGQVQTEQESAKGEGTLWRWQALRSVDPPMVELVTEVTGGGGCKQWAVLRTDEKADPPEALQDEHTIHTAP